jgi:hypothetical protein
MSNAYIELAETSPNRVVSGHIGCLVSDQPHEDCREPVLVFPHIERESNLFPHAVLCSFHADECQALRVNGEILAGGEDGVDDDIVTVPDDAVTELAEDESDLI